MIPPLEAEREKALLRDWARGSRTSGEALIGALLPGIFGLCLRMLRNEADAQDAVQETFVKLTAEVGKGTEIRELRKWLATVAMNKSIDIQRARKKVVQLEESGAMEPGEMDPEPADKMDVQTLKTWMQDLPERYQKVLHLHFTNGLSPKEIAESMNLEAGTARVLLHRAVTALRKKAKK